MQPVTPPNPTENANQSQGLPPPPQIRPGAHIGFTLPRMAARSQGAIVAPLPIT